MKRRDLCFTSIVGNFTPAKIYMWTAVRLENEGSTVQLFCRANGWPVPKISWYKISTRGKLQSLLHSNFCQQYKVIILPLSRLSVNNIIWKSIKGVFSATQVVFLQTDDYKLSDCLFYVSPNDYMTS